MVNSGNEGSESAGPGLGGEADEALRALVDAVATTYLGQLADYPADTVIAEQLCEREDLVDIAEQTGCSTVGELSQYLLLMAVRPVAVSALGDDALGKVTAMFSTVVQGMGDGHEFTGAARAAYESIAIAGAERDLSGSA
ncbi:hypothetical protein [Mycolicibacterium peregrinum]|uniref:Uncharacterized protein n=1 Tax=Mycolicibacterium peregrinum TaxID=43304 RepID=A0A1A0WC35_MYCPR|nr:hypothetical protein [Mycolicibacterium peregrinum]OBB94631.1 hypothetical protein A5779_19550 [Mycolicibacterium peregrinum]